MSETIYRGSYHDMVLAVSPDRSLVKKYLKNIRGLQKSEYDIDEVRVSSVSYHKFSKYILREFTKNLYLPERDCTALESEIDISHSGMIDTVNSMKSYLKIISGIDDLDDSAIQLRETIDTMESDLKDKKLSKKITKRIIKLSPIMSPNIHIYLDAIKRAEEMEALDDLYYGHLYGDE